MSQQEASDSHSSNWLENSTPLDDDLEIVRLSAARARGMDEAGAAIARQLNGPLTALLLYMGELKQHSHQFSQATENRVDLQQVVENAFQQTEHVCARIKQIAGTHEQPAAAPRRNAGWETRNGHATAVRAPGVMFSSSAGKTPLTKREREGLSLISDGYSNKRGAFPILISPRTFESHRA